jgi:hypothetical protein
MIVPQSVRGSLVSIGSLIVGAGLWELVGRHTQQSSFAPFSKTIGALWAMTTSGELPRAAESSL